MTGIPEDKRKNIRLDILLVLFVVVSLTWGLSWLLIINNTWLPDWNARGTFGDMFGAVNALFSGLAFAGVIYAIYLQTNELKLQREELEQTRIELERSANAQDATQLALNKQVTLQALAACINIESNLMQQTIAGSQGRQDAIIRIKKLQDQVNRLLEESNWLP